MVGEVLAGVQAFKSVFDALGAIKDAGDAAIRNTITVDLTTRLIALQQAYFMLEQENAVLKKDLIRIEDWKNEAERYALHEFVTGRFTYRISEEVQGTEPVHDLCTNCYAQRQKSILQSKTGAERRKYLFCGACKLEIEIT